MTVYGARPDLRDVLYIAVSQSGGSPDLVRSVEVARQQGALTLAVTNNAASASPPPPRSTSTCSPDAERSVAATKSYTAELLALYLLLERARGGDGRAADALPDLGAQVLASGELVRNVAQRYRFAQRLITTGRGYSLPHRPGGRAEAHGDVLPFRAGVFGRRPPARPTGHGGPAGAGARRRPGRRRR